MGDELENKVEPVDEGGGCCKRECSLKGLGLKHQQPELFYNSQWSCTPLIYVIYRIIIGIYFFVWIILTGTGNRRYTNSEANRIKWFIFLTNWTNFVLTTCVMLQAVIAVFCYVKFTRRDVEPPTITWYLRLQWVWYNIAINSGFVLTALYWGLLYSSDPVPLEELNFHTHAFNSIYILIDLFITAIPLHLLHFLHGMAYSVVYLIFSMIYTLSGGTNSKDKPYIYSVLSWTDSPGVAAAYAAATVLVGIPVVWLLCYALFKLRLLIACKCCSGTSCCVNSDGHDFQQNYPMR